MKIEIYKTSAGYTVIINDYRICGIKLLPGNKLLQSSYISEDALVRAQRNNKEDLQTTTNIDYTAALENALCYLHEKGIIDTTEDSFIGVATRLNAAIKKQHCV